VQPAASLTGDDNARSTDSRSQQAEQSDEGRAH